MNILIHGVSPKSADVLIIARVASRSLFLGMNLHLNGLGYIILELYRRCDFFPYLIKVFGDRERRKDARDIDVQRGFGKKQP